MKPNNYIVLIFWLLSFFQELKSQVPAIEWQHCYGGTNDDAVYSIGTTNDAGYIACGISNSSDGDVTNNYGNYDYWIIKLDSLGGLEWQRNFGGSDLDYANYVQQTMDGGYIVAGTTLSINGDVIGNHSTGYSDGWIIKLDSSGLLEWKKCYGGSLSEGFQSLCETIDGEFVIAGLATSNDGDVSGSHGGEDYWVVKIDGLGNLIWQKCFGGFAGGDLAYSIKITPDQGYVVAGTSTFTNGDCVGAHGMSDFWILKLDSSGNIIWKLCYGGSLIDVARNISLTSDSGFIVVGYSESSDGDATMNHGLQDYWVIKINGNGNLQWQKSLGGTSMEEGYGVFQTLDDGYLVFGCTNSSNGDVSGAHGGAESWIIKLANTGTISWQKCLGSTDDDLAFSGLEAADGGLIIAGGTYSNSGQVSGNHGGADVWVVKLSPLSDAVVEPSSLITDFTSYLNHESDELYLNFYASINERIEMQFFDMTGRILLSKPITATAGPNKQQIYAGELSSGIYLVRLISESGGFTTKLMVE